MTKWQLILIALMLASCSTPDQKINYYSDGSINTKTEYRNGKKNGIESVYDTAGNLLIEATFKNDTLDGSKITYYPSGVVASKMNYKRGVPHGEFFVYFSSGNLVKHGYYRDGIIVEKYTEYYDDPGAKIATESYILTVRGEELLYYKIKYDPDGEVLSEERPISVNAPDSMKINEKVSVDFEINSSLKYDSAFLIFGGLDENFFSQAKSDTVKIDSDRFSYFYQPESKGDSYLRGAVILYSNEVSGDTIFETSDYKFFEIPIKIY